MLPIEMVQLQLQNKHKDSFLPDHFLIQPWLIRSHGADKPIQTFIHPTHGTVEEKEVPQMHGKLCFGCIHEWLLLWDDESKECFLLEPCSLSIVPFPPLTEPPDYLLNFSLTSMSSVNHPDCAIIFIGVESSEHDDLGYQNYFLYSRCHENRWTKLPLHGEYLIGETSVVHEGKLYTHNSTNNVVIFDLPSLLEGRINKTTLSTPKFPMYPRTDRSSLNLVESCGQIYLVRIKYYGQGPPSYVDIHSFDVTSNSWLRVDTIGDHAFFLGERCYASVDCATDIEAQSNCIYCVASRAGDEQRMYKFCLDDYTMTFSLIPEDRTEYESTLCWFAPKRVPRTKNCSMQCTLVLNEATKDAVHTEQERLTDNVRPWGELPIDLLESILPDLSLVNVLRLCAVCKAWSLIRNPFAKTKSTWPWLMYKAKECGTYKLLDPIDNKEYETRIKRASWENLTLMLSSKDGWVLNLDNDFSVSMMNPLHQALIELPRLEGLERGFHGVTFTSIPTSPDCVVFGISTNVIAGSIEIFEWRPGDEKWNKQAFHNEVSFQAANTSPVFFHGELYCLGEHGHLGVFNPETKTWRVLEKPASVYIDQEDAPFRGTHDCYLLELNDELVSVFRSNYSGYGVSVFRLDRTKMDWIEVDDLTDWALFLDHRSSFAKPSPHETSSNKIFFSAFFSSTCVTYCMETRKFNMDFSNAKEPLDCVWLEPNLTGDYDMHEEGMN